MGDGGTMDRWQVCGECGAAVVGVALHGAWHRRLDRREAEARVLHDEVEDLRDRLLDEAAGRRASRVEP